MLLLDFKVIRSNEIVDEFFLTSCSSFWELYSKNSTHNDCHKLEESMIKLNSNCRRNHVQKYKVTMDSYLISIFHNVIENSVSYRSLFADHIQKKANRNINASVNQILICIFVVAPKQEIIDFKGNEMFAISSLEKRELDNAMAWLSTLGGAFSALGDSIENCATLAGKISVRQLQIAIRLGDPHLVARCKLYMALSLIQKHNFIKAKHIIQEQYKFARRGPINDGKLTSMCLGIWAKLKYDSNKLKETFKKKCM